MSESPAPAPPSPPRPLLACLGLSFLLAVFPLAYTVHYARVWWRERAGKSFAEQRDAYPNTPWLQPVYRRFATWLDERLPAGAAVLVTPIQLARTGPRGVTLDDLEDSGRSRWFLYLNYDLYPRAVYVRQPALASGTLVDYPEWVRHHDEVLNVDGRHAQSIEEMKQRAIVEQREREAFAAIEARHGALYELLVPTVREFRTEGVRLFRCEAGERAEELPVPGLQELLRATGQEAGGGPEGAGDGA